MVLPVTSGLVLHLESDSGVSTSGGTVTGWTDASGSANDLTVTGDPTLVAGVTQSGADAIALDGTGDSLERLALSGLPVVNEDRTVFFVVDYKDPQGVVSGFAYGNPSFNRTFGLTANTDNDLLLQGFSTTNDFDSDVDGVTGGFIVQSAVHDAGTLDHYLDGALIDSFNHTYNTVANKLVIGEEIKEAGHSIMDVAAVIVYDRALSEAERQQVEVYLQDKYTAVGGNVTPVVEDDSGSVSAPAGSTDIDVLANDFDDNALDGSMITITSGPSNGTISNINLTTGVITYDHDGGAATSDSFTYTLTDGGGAVSEEATVDITIESDQFSLDGFSNEMILDRAGMTNATSSFFQPISMAFLPDNRMLLLSKDGEILIVDPETGSHDSYMVINNIDSGQERGLLDITLDPDFSTNGYFYLYYTPNSPENARIARFQHQENAGGLSSTGNLASETTLWEDTDGYLACCHYGGGLDFGPDGKIWLTTADKFQSTTPGEGPAGGNDLPLDLTSSSGKIIRINDDGSIPDGTDGSPANPYIDGPGGNDDSIWAYGLRNPFRARWDEDYGYMYIGEVGGNQQVVAHDDLHLASLDQDQAFYGWPFYEGTPNTTVNGGQSSYDPNNFPAPDNDLADSAGGDFFSNPIFSIPHNGNSVSMTGGEVYRGSMFPSEWDGVYFYGDYTNDYIRYLRLDSTGTQVLGDFDFKPSTEIPGTTNEIVSINVGEDGALYYLLISTGEVHRVVYDSNQAPDINASDVTPLAGALPLMVTFTANVTDPDGDTMTYTLNFGDGTVFNNVPVPGSGNINVQHTYTVDGAYDVSFSVTDGTRTSFGAPFEVEAGDVNDPPVITGEDSDLDDTEVATPVTFTANVTDADGDPMTYTWYFGDGNSASGTVPVSGIVEETYSYSTEGNFDAFLEVSDGEETVVSADVPVLIGEPAEVPVTDGLVLLLQSDIKIGLGAGTTVTSWLDGSGNGNNLFAQGDPQLLEDQTATGQPAIVFDGIGDLLQRVNSTDTIFNLPAGNDDRTVIIVVDYDNPNGTFAGAAYGDDQNNQAFGLVASSDDQLTVQGWGGTNDFKSGVNATSGGFMVQAVTLTGGSTSHYQNGTLIDSDAHTYNTDVREVMLGAQIGGAAQAGMSLGAVLIYDRALSASELTQVQDFLEAKYITNQAPEAEDDAFSVDQDTVLSSGNVLDDNGSGADSDPNPGQVLSVNTTPVTDVSDGTLVLNDDGTFTYTPDAGFFGTDSFTYELTDNVGAIDTATATITVNQVGGATEGDDTILLGGSVNDLNIFALGGNDYVETGSGNDSIQGDAGDDTLLGGAGNDTLKGGLGTDSMIGGLGDDIFSVNSVADQVREDPGEGTDTVRSTVTYNLQTQSQNIEKMLLGGSDKLDGTGNNLDNVLTGNNNRNTLIGGQGDDTLNGRAGVDDLKGGAGNDRLKGGFGADTHAGGAGDDTYIVDNTNDVVIEGTGNGDDLVQSSAAFYSLQTQGDNVEDLVLIGSADIDGNGNKSDNFLAGNSGANILKASLGDDVVLGKDGNDDLHGGGGDDVLNGGAGDDTLNGAADEDRFVFDEGFGNDIINGFSLTDDTIDLSNIAAIVDFTDLQANHLTEVAGDSVITDGANTITINNIANAAIIDDLFQF